MKLMKSDERTTSYTLSESQMAALQPDLITSDMASYAGAWKIKEDSGKV